MFELRPVALVLLAIVFSPCAFAGRVSLSVKDASGAPFPKVLVIIRRLEFKGEVLRGLTDREGIVPGVDLQPGLYRVIATYPYGLWSTGVREFLVTSEPLNLSITLHSTPTTDDIGFIGAPSRTVHVVDRNGNPISGAEVLVRDETATHEMWYTSNSMGDAEVELFADPTILVVVDPPYLVERSISVPSRSNTARPEETGKQTARKGPPIVFQIR
jgi:hypothetical protein